MGILTAWHRRGLQKRVNEAAAVFDREADPHGDRVSGYLFDLLREIRMAGVMAETLGWGPVIALADKIRESDEETPFDPSGELHVHKRWEGAHLLMCDVLTHLLGQHPDFARKVVGEHGGGMLAFARHAIGYALRLVDLSAPDGRAEPDGSESSRPAAVYLRIIRGVIVDVLEGLIHGDHDRETEREGKAAAGAKVLFEEILIGEHQDVAMFHFGRRAWALYDRDPDWVHGLFPAIFPEDAARRNLRLAALTGFLARVPTWEMFWDPEVQELYRWGLGLDRKADEPLRPRWNPDFADGIARHFAFAYLRQKAFGFDHPLFKTMLARGDPGQLGAFAEMAGKQMSRPPRDHSPAVRRRLVRFWEWMLANHTDPKPFAEFGMWMSLHHGMFDSVTLARLAKETLRKSRGKLDWVHGLTISMERLAHDAPEDALEIADLFLHAGAGDPFARSYLASERGEWRDAVDFLCENADTRELARSRLGDVREVLLPSSVSHAV